MSQPLETIVRPFEAPDFRPRYLAASYPSKEVPDDDGLVEFGSAGANVFDIQASFQSKLPESDTKKEVRRTYDVVRVKNPDDEDQHVDVEVMTAFQLRSQYAANSKVGNRSTYNMGRPVETENTEIISRNNHRTSTV